MEPLVAIPTPKRSLEEFICYAATFGISQDRAQEYYHICKDDEVFVNRTYSVIRREVPDDMNPSRIPGIKWLSIRRIDGRNINEWEVMQEIKNRLLGNCAEAIQIFPTQSGVVNAENQYHLFGGLHWKAPFGFPR